MHDWYSARCSGSKADNGANDDDRKHITVVQSNRMGLNTMSDDPTLVKIEADDLEQRIQAARSHYGAVCEADKDWQDMVRAHTELQRREHPFRHRHRAQLG